MSEAAAAFLIRARGCLPCDPATRDEIQRELPPLAILWRILAVIERVVADPSTCRDATQAEGPAAELEAIAAAIAAQWGEAGDWFALAEGLDSSEARRSLRATGPTREPRAFGHGSDRCAWDPMDDASLSSWLAAPDVATLREASEAWIPFGMWVACVASASLLRASESESRLTLRDEPPHAWLADQGAHRALVLAALARLRRLVESGFPGLASLLQSKTSRPRSVAGPYRAHVASDAGADAAAEQERPHVSPLEARLEPAHLEELFDEAFDHALRSALHLRPPPELEALPRSVRRQREEAAKAAAKMERGALPLVRARGVLRVLELGLFPVALHEAVIELHSAAGGFAIEESFMKEPIVRHLARAGRALGAVRSLLGVQLGLAVDATRLAADVAGHLRVAAPRPPLDRYEELVHAISLVLAGTSFAPLHASLGSLARELEDEVREAAAADARVHWYERIFGDGPDAVARDGRRASAEAAQKALATTIASVRGYLEGALKTVLPQALAYFRIFDLEVSLSRVRLVEVVELASAREVSFAVAGDREFRAHLELWTGDLLRGFGHLPSPGEVLEGHAARLLEGAAIPRAHGETRV